jgi:hypothetical protein
MRALSLRALAIATLVVAGGCDRGVTEPAPATTGSSANRLLLGTPRTVTVVERTTPLAAPISASATLGILGGQINLPGAGLKVVVPAFALTKTTKITVTAVAGSQVAYEFEPHGTQFLVPLLVTQNLSGTNAVSGGLFSRPVFAGYFASLSDLNPLSNSGLVSELLGVALNLSNKSATFPVFHFSGYLIATGRDMEELDESDAR